jgi:uncharacterized protein YxeA
LKKIIAGVFAVLSLFAFAACGTTHTYEAKPVDGERCFVIEREVSTGDEVTLGTYCLQGEFSDDYDEPESEFYDD